MADRKITITRSGNSLSVSSDPFTIKPANNLSWTCNGGDFAVLFANNRSPFASGKKVHAAHSGDSTKKLKIRDLKTAEQAAPVGDRLNGATFKYGVAVIHPVSGVVLTLDPDLIVDDPGGGGR